MSKINPLQKITEIPDERTNGTQKLDRKNSIEEPFRLDRVEISPRARLVQSAQSLQKSTLSELTEDAHRLGNYWYLYGYHLIQADGLK